MKKRRYNRKDLDRNEDPQAIAGSVAGATGASVGAGIGLATLGPVGAIIGALAGAALEAAGATYYNPDDAARRYIQTGMPPAEANARAWRRGLAQLEQAILRRTNYAFETTLGGRTMTRRLQEAGAAGMTVRIWYVGLASAEKHIERVKARVRRGGHDIPEARIRSRWTTSRENLVRLLPVIHELVLFDNTADARLDKGESPEPRRLLHLRAGSIVALAPPDTMPVWARSIVAAALLLATNRP